MPAASPGLRLARGEMRIFGAAPWASSSHSVGRGDEFAVAVARDDVGECDRGQGARLVQLLAAFLDRAFVGQVAQQRFSSRAIGVLQTEGAGDLARADFAGCVADEGEELLAGGKCGVLFRAWPR